MSRRSQPESRLGAGTETQAGRFLFDDKELNQSQFLDMRTRINSPETGEFLLYLGTLAEGLKSKGARITKDLFQRILIAHRGEGRDEAVKILQQNLPRRRVIEVGVE